MKKLLILLLLPITIFSQENYYDTTIARLINEKINEYRIEKGLHAFIETDSLYNNINTYTNQAAKKLANGNRTIKHSKYEKHGEVCAYSPVTPNFVTKKEGYNLIRSADSIATAVLNGYKSSPGHNSLILQKPATKFITSVYIFYHGGAFQSWSIYTATNFLNPDWNLCLSYENLENE